MHSIVAKLSLLLISLTVVLAAPQQAPPTHSCPRGTGLANAQSTQCTICPRGTAWSNVGYRTMCHYCVRNTWSNHDGASGCSSPCNFPYQVIPDPTALPGSTLFGNIDCIIPP